MTSHLLPTPSGLHLYECDQEQVKSAGPFPVSHPTLWCWSDDRGHVMTVDQERKRVSAFRFDGVTFEPIMSPQTLPKGVNAHCIAMKGSQVYVGAQSVWVPLDEGGWEQIPMPGFARGEGKRLDGLIIDGDRLVAVDDLLLPKWNLEYDIQAPETPVYVRAMEMHPNITYERIYAATGGTRWFVTLSRGINHGNEGSFCTLFALGNLQQAYAYPFYHRFAGSRCEGVQSLFDAVFLGDTLCLLGHTEDSVILHWLDLSDTEPPPPLTEPEDPREMPRTRRSSRSHQQREKLRRRKRPELLEERVEGLKRVLHIQGCTDQQGLYLAGQDADGEHHLIWHPRPTALTPAAPDRADEMS
ncbi:MAG: hypothetical protein VX938_00075 [Myxococcota bacterium]|nr:hypothetical protein [Myxococcota bacterium]